MEHFHGLKCPKQKKKDIYVYRKWTCFVHSFSTPVDVATNCNDSIICKQSVMSQTDVIFFVCEHIEILINLKVKNWTRLLVCTTANKNVKITEEHTWSNDNKDEESKHDGAHRIGISLLRAFWSFLANIPFKPCYFPVR